MTINDEYMDQVPVGEGRSTSSRLQNRDTQTFYRSVITQKVLRTEWCVQC